MTPRDDGGAGRIGVYLTTAKDFGDFELLLDYKTVEAAAEALAGVCDRAREHGLLVTLEYLPWSGIPDAATALAIVLRSGRANASLMFDTWHTFRGPTDEAQLEKIPGARIGSVQINDAPVQPGDNLIAETMSARLQPYRSGARYGVFDAT